MFGIHFDRHTLGNLAKNLSPAAGLLGGPIGLAAAGGLSALGDLGRGKNIGEAVKGGVKNAALGAGLHAGVGAARGLLNGGAPAGIAPVGGPPPAAATDMVAHGGLQLPSVSNLTTAATKPIDPRSLMTKVGDKVGGVFDWAEGHPNAAAGALQGLGSIAGSGAENRTHNAQADLLEKQAEETEYDFQKRRARDAQLAPVWSSLGSTIGGNYNSIAANPYLPKAG